MNNSHKSPLKISLDRIEELIWYAIVSCVILINVLALFVPSINAFIDKNLNLNFSLLVLIVATFRLLHKKATQLGKQALPHASDAEFLQSEVQSLIKKHQYVKRLDIVGYSTRHFYNALENIKFTADEVRILLKNPNENSHASTGENSFINTYARYWKTKLNEINCARIDIRSYKFKSVIFGMAIAPEHKDVYNNGYFGLFSPTKKKDPEDETEYFPDILGFYSINSDTHFGRGALIDFAKWFNDAFENHSDKVYIKSNTQNTQKQKGGHD